MSDKQGCALEDVKVLDFSWSIVGPLTTKCLATYGATVVKVESKERIDIARTYYPMADNKPGIDRCGWFDLYATGKHSIGLNLNKPQGIELAKKLVTWADVVVETFTGGTMERWGLAYPDMVKINPDIIMIGMSLFGQSGPLMRQSGFGLQMQAYAGFTHLVGWPDRPPTGNSCPYTDYIAPWYGIVAILGALDYRRRTGKGQYIDLSQFEAGVTFLAPAILEYTANNRVMSPIGNRSNYAAPHGAYRCQGDDRWCAITVSSDEEWEALCRVMGKPELTKDPKFATLQARKENEDELDRLIERWTINQPEEQVMLKLQEAGVPAGFLKDARDLLRDPQLKHRQHYVELDHPEIGVHSYEQPTCRLSKTPAEIRRSPLFCEHNEYIYTGILGLSDEEFVELLVSGVLE
ncbi:CaiB/BaiF CoA transferase family protein [Chloroflexota bacterium]